MPNGDNHTTAQLTPQAALRRLQGRLAAIVVFMSSDVFLHLLFGGFLCLTFQVVGLSPAVLGLLCIIVSLVALFALFVQASFDAISALLLNPQRPLHQSWRLRSRFDAVSQDLPTLLRPPRLATFVSH